MLLGLLPALLQRLLVQHGFGDKEDHHRALTDFSDRFTDTAGNDDVSCAVEGKYEPGGPPDARYMTLMDMPVPVDDLVVDQHSWACHDRSAAQVGVVSSIGKWTVPMAIARQS